MSKKCCVTNAESFRSVFKDHCLQRSLSSKIAVLPVSWKSRRSMGRRSVSGVHSFLEYHVSAHVHCGVSIATKTLSIERLELGHDRSESSIERLEPKQKIRTQPKDQNPTIKNWNPTKKSELNQKTRTQPKDQNPTTTELT